MAYERGKKKVLDSKGGRGKEKPLQHVLKKK